MNDNYIKLNISLPRQVRTKRLIKELGYEGFYSLVQLACYAAEFCPNGDMTDMTTDEIALAAGWKGYAPTFVDALDDFGFLVHEKDGVDGLFVDLE